MKERDRKRERKDTNGETGEHSFPPPLKKRKLNFLENKNFKL